MSYKEFVLFAIGCLSLAIGLIFGQAEMAAAADESASVSIVQQSESVMRGQVFTVYNDN